MYFWRHLRTLHLLACQVRGTIGSLSFVVVCVGMSYESYITHFVLLNIKRTTLLVQVCTTSFSGTFFLYLASDSGTWSWTHKLIPKYVGQEIIHVLRKVRK